MISNSTSSFSRRRGATVAGIFGVVLSSVLLLCGAGSVPIENLLPQGAMQGDLNAGGHNLTNAATLSAANVSATNSLVVPSNFFSTNNVVQTTGSYANPSWLTSLAWSKLTGTSTNVPTPMTTLGDMMYGGASGVNTRLAGSTSNGIAFLTQNGTGSASAAPEWMSSGIVNLNSFALKNVYLCDNSATESLDGSNRQFYGSSGGAPLNGLLKVSNSGPWTTAAVSDVPTPMTALGDLMYGGTGGINTRLVGSTSSGIAFLTQTGTGSVSAAPQWASSGTLNFGAFALKNVYIYDNSGTECLDAANREIFGSGGGAPLNGLLKVSNSGPWTAAVAGSDYPGLSTANTFTASQTITSGNLVMDTAGNGFQVKEGSNAKQGTVTLVAGTVTVSNTSVTANSRIFLTTQSPGGTVGVPYVSARATGTSFTITSTSGSDTSTVGYEIFEPAP